MLTRSFIRNAATTPLDARLMNMASILPNDSTGNPRVGVLGPLGAPLVIATGTMTVNVVAAEFATSKGKGDGVSIFTNDGTVTGIAIDPAPASNSRIDVVWVKHNDNTTGDANSLPVFGVTTGIAGATPIPSAIPTGALELAQVRIYSGTTATNGAPNTITQTAQYTAARGGTVAFRNKTELDLWTTAAVGQEAINLATGERFSRTLGGAWVLTFRPMQSWAPAVAGLTIGNGLTSYRYGKRDGMIEFVIQIASGSTTAVTGAITIALPEAPVLLAGVFAHIGEGLIRYAGSASGEWPIQGRLAGSSLLSLNMLDASGAFLSVGSNVSNTVPTSGAWSGATLRPTIYLHGSYPAAA